jgi:hypothetical protein
MKQQPQNGGIYDAKAKMLAVELDPSDGELIWHRRASELAPPPGVRKRCARE